MLIMKRGNYLLKNWYPNITLGLFPISNGIIALPIQCSTTQCARNMLILCEMGLVIPHGKYDASIRGTSLYYTYDPRTRKNEHFLS